MRGVAGLRGVQALGFVIALLCAVAATPAGAEVRQTEIVSIGAGPPQCCSDKNAFRAVSDDGSRVIFATRKQLLLADTDSSTDLYERSANTTTLLSTGPSGGNTDTADVYFVGASRDAARVYFISWEKLVPEDTDVCTSHNPPYNSNSGVGCIDLYERSGGVTTLISGPQSGSPANADVAFQGISRDGSNVVFDTTERLTPDDTDSGGVDLYQHTGGVTARVSAGPADTGGVPVCDLCSAGTSTAQRGVAVSDDGAHVFFTWTGGALTADDADTCPGSGSCRDVYERFAGTTQLVSTGPGGGSGTAQAALGGISADGLQAFFTTSEKLDVTDTDACFNFVSFPPTPIDDGCVDVYERAGGVTTLMTPSPTATPANQDVTYGGATPDGSRVFFMTHERLTTADFDASQDLYVRTGGMTTLVSTPPVSGGNAEVRYGGSSSDGSHVFFQTIETLTGDDRDGGQDDVYERFAGGTHLVSGGPLSNQAGSGLTVQYNGTNDEGTRVYFTTNEQLTPDDYDPPDACCSGGNDVYQRYAGDTTLISTGPLDSEPGEAVWGGLTPDAKRVFWSTPVELVAADRDTSDPDLYASNLVGDGYARVKGATPVFASLVPAFTPCASPNRTHAAPLSFGSCNPPAQTSPRLTVGTPDANGAAAASNGSVALHVVGEVPINTGNGNQADITVAISVTDVRVSSDLSDYPGELRAQTGVRITDQDNGTPGPGTVSDTSFGTTVPCATNADPAVGSTCSVTTSANTVVPGSVIERKRAVWQLGQVNVYDGGADGDGDTPGDNTLFMTQGVFAP
jgi:hypothetical protein